MSDKEENYELDFEEERNPGLLAKNDDTSEPPSKEEEAPKESTDDFSSALDIDIEEFDLSKTQAMETNQYEVVEISIPRWDKTYRSVVQPINPDPLHRSSSWNQRYQDLVDLPCDNAHLAGERSRGIIQLQASFIETCARIAKILVQDLFTPRSKRHLKSDLSQNVVVLDGIAFEIIETDMISKKLGEMKAISAVNRLQRSGLHTPLCGIFEYQGVCVYAIALFPVDLDDTLVYGKKVKPDKRASDHESTKTEDMVLKSNDEMNEHMNSIRTQYNLREFTLFSKKKKGKSYKSKGSRFLSCSGHMCQCDNRLYVTKMENLFPYAPAEYASGPGGLHSIPVHQYRPEFLEQNCIHMQMSGGGISKIAGNNLRAFYRLCQLMEDFSRDLDQLDTQLTQKKKSTKKRTGSRLKPQLNLQQMFHSRGINMRYLGQVRAKVRSKALKELLLQEMVARATKGYFRSTRQESRKTEVEEENSNGDVNTSGLDSDTYRFIVMIFRPGALIANQFWCGKLPDLLEQKYSSKVKLSDLEKLRSKLDRPEAGPFAVRLLQEIGLTVRDRVNTVILDLRKESSVVLLRYYVRHKTIEVSLAKREDFVERQQQLLDQLHTRGAALGYKHESLRTALWDLVSFYAKWRMIRPAEARRGMQQVSSRLLALHSKHSADRVRDLRILCEANRLIGAHNESFRLSGLAIRRVFDDPEADLTAFVEIANLHLQRGELKQAKEFLECAIRLGMKRKRQYPNAQLEYAKVMAEIGEFDHQRDTLLDLESNDAFGAPEYAKQLSECYRNLGEWAVSKGRHAEGVGFIQQSIYIASNGLQGSNRLVEVNALRSLAKAYQRLNDLDAVHGTMNKASTLLTQINGDECLETARIWSERAELYAMAEDSKECYLASARALDVCSRLFSPQQSVRYRIKILIIQAAAHKHISNPKRMLEPLRRARKMQEEQQGLGNSSPYELLDALVPLAEAYRRCRMIHEWKATLETAILVSDRAYDEAITPRRSRIMVSLSKVYAVTGQHGKRKHLLEQALKRYEEWGFDGWYPEILDCAVELGGTYRDLRNFPQMRMFLSSMLEKLEKVAEEKSEIAGGFDLPRMAELLQLLAAAYRHCDDGIDHQKTLLERALIMNQKWYGKGHIEVARTLRSLASVYELLERSELQTRSLRLAWSIVEPLAEQDTQLYADILTDLASVMDVQEGKAQHALEMLNNGTITVEYHYNAFAESLADGDERKERDVQLRLYRVSLSKIFAEMARQRSKLCEFEIELEILERLFVLEKEVYGKFHPAIAKTLIRLAAANARLGHYKPRLKHLHRALQILTQSLSPTHPLTTLLKQHIARGLERSSPGEFYDRIDKLTTGPQFDLNVHVLTLSQAMDDENAASRLLDESLDDDIDVEADKAEEKAAIDSLGISEENIVEMKTTIEKKKKLEEKLVTIEREHGKKHLKVAQALAKLSDTCLRSGLLQQHRRYLRRALRLSLRHNYYLNLNDNMFLLPNEDKSNMPTAPPASPIAYKRPENLVVNIKPGKGTATGAKSKEKSKTTIRPKSAKIRRGRRAKSRPKASKLVQAYREC